METLPRRVSNSVDEWVHSHSGMKKKIGWIMIMSVLIPVFAMMFYIVLALSSWREALIAFVVLSVVYVGVYLAES